MLAKSESITSIIILIIIDSSQLLFVRLYLRKHRWLRADKITYPDIADDLVTCIKELVKNEFLHDGNHYNNYTFTVQH